MVKVKNNIIVNFEDFWSNGIIDLDKNLRNNLYINNIAINDRLTFKSAYDQENEFNIEIGNII